MDEIIDECMNYKWISENYTWGNVLLMNEWMNESIINVL